MDSVVLASTFSLPILHSRPVLVQTRQRAANCQVNLFAQTSRQFEGVDMSLQITIETIDDGAISG